LKSVIVEKKEAAGNIDSLKFAKESGSLTMISARQEDRGERADED